MKRKMLFMTLLILALSALGAVSFGILLKNSQTRTQNGATAQEGGLLVYGLVQHPLNLTFDEIAAMPESTVNATLYCVDFPTAPRASGNWTGVRLAYLLQQAVVSQAALKVAFYAKDGYTTDLTVQTAMSKDIIVAYQRNGEPLQEGLRLVVPGRFGYKWISEMTRIELVNYDFKGYWESRGYSDEALIP
jgi:DMSO/TMAO reductase YedYZ molybdopterin-dependent catalytic subunit